MKFGEDLTSHLTSEWRAQYLAYEELKASLYDVKEKAPSAEEQPEERERYFMQADAAFFDRINEELQKVQLFYNERRADAERKLHELQRELHAFDQIAATAKKDKNRAMDGGSAAPKSAMKSTASTSADNRWMLSSLLPLGANAAKVAEKQHAKTLDQMKFAYSEFYHLLTLLQNYQVLNRTGFRKILKKHDKLFGNKSGLTFFEGKVEKSPFVDEKVVGQLIETVENTFTQLEHGDRQVAMKRLRVPPLSERQSAWTTFRLGLFLGAFAILSLIIVSIVSADNLQRPPEPKWVGVRLFRGFLILFANIWLMGLNVYGWQRNGVNHVLIFEIDPRNHLTYQGLMEVASWFCCLWALCAVGYLYVPMLHESVSPFIFPLILMGVSIIWMVQPFDWMNRSSRYWFIRHVFNGLTAPFHHVSFADFWLGDQMNSLATFFLDMEYFVCFYATEVDWTAASPMIGNGTTPASVVYGTVNYATGADVCFSNAWAIRPLVSLIPATVRFMQCLRRYRDDRKVFPHLVNAGKYSTSYFVVSLGVANSAYKSANNVDNTHSPLFYLWITAYIVSFVYTFTWDVWMDWSLMSANSKRPGLRDELVYNHVAYYYFAIVNDFVLRLSWVLNLSLGDTWKESADLMLCVTSLLECWRRFVWNFLRLENEHINNCGNFRAVRDISLKPMKQGDIDRLIEKMDMAHGVRHRAAELQTPLKQQRPKAADKIRQKLQMPFRKTTAHANLSPSRTAPGDIADISNTRRRGSR